MKYFLLLSFMVTCFLTEAQRPFITTWKTIANNESITIPTTGSGYNYSVNWGDGVIEPGLTGGATHTYVTAGIYTVSITGSFPRIYFYNSPERKRILTIEQWGDIAWTSMENTFNGCSNLKIPATDAPNLSQVTSMSGTFAWSNFNEPIGHWDVSSVNDMSKMFYAARFNQGLKDWNVSKVTDMTAMFSQTTDFNQPIGNWNVGSVIDMSGMFDGAKSFNQLIGDWNVSMVTNMGFMFQNTPSFNQPIGAWNVDNVKNMGSMFAGAKLFNQSINDWNVSNITHMTWMFSGAFAFNQALNNWDVSKVTNMHAMFNNSALSTGNYDITLSGWAALPSLQTNIVLGASGLNFCSSETERKQLKDTYGWTIKGDSLSCGTTNK